MNLKCSCQPWKETSTHKSRECWWDKKQTSIEGADGKELYDVGLEYPYPSSVLIFSKVYNIWWWEQNLFSWWAVLHRKHLRPSLLFLVSSACTDLCFCAKSCSTIALTYLCSGFIWTRVKVFIGTELLVHMETSCEEMENFCEALSYEQGTCSSLWVACLVSLCCLLPRCLKLMGMVCIL